MNDIGSARSQTILRNGGKSYTGNGSDSSRQKIIAAPKTKRNLYELKII